MKKLAVVGTFVAGAVVGFVGGTAAVSYSVVKTLKSEKLRSTLAKGLGELIYNCYLAADDVKDRTRKISYSSYTDRERRKFNYTSYYGWHFETRGEAESVLDDMEQLISEHGFVSVQDFYELCGGSGMYADNELVWCTTDGMTITIVRDGYRLSLPEPVEKCSL